MIFCKVTCNSCTQTADSCQVSIYKHNHNSCACKQPCQPISGTKFLPNEDDQNKAKEWRAKPSSPGENSNRNALKTSNDVVESVVDIWNGKTRRNCCINALFFASIKFHLKYSRGGAQNL